VEPRATVLALVGPTAVGKTAVALALAARLPVDLISLDSAMVYRGMDIGTAKPSAEVLKRFPHALLDIRNPTESYSAASFLNDADQAVTLALARGRLPVLVGGTMLYLKSFREGLALLPEADPGLRAQIQQEAQRFGWQALHDELTRFDPRAAAGIHPNNPQRLIRALEVFRSTGLPISDFWQQQKDQNVGHRLRVNLTEVALVPDDRRLLHERINARFQAMLDAGLIDEVIGLRARFDLSLDLPSMRAVGYRQVWQFLEGDLTYQGLVQAGAAATRQLAKRQLTWLRSWPQVRSIPWGESADIADKLLRDSQLEIC
jgi:tRNA dimethylallyltransferase